MIIVKNRELLIPNNERYIGTIYDTESENRQFLISRFSQSGTDLSAMTFRLDLQYPDTTRDTVLLDAEIQEESILLTWTITAAQVRQVGTVFLQIRAGDENFTTRWSSFQAAIYVEDHINTPEHYSGDLSELEQLEAQFAAIYASEQARVAAEAGRVVAEGERVVAEVAREDAFDEAISEFNRDRQDLYNYMLLSKSWAVGDTGVRTGEDMDNSMYWAQRSSAYADAAEEAKEICEIYSDIIVPVFTVDFATGNLVYNDTSTFTFTINQTSGELDYVYTPA